MKFFSDLISRRQGFEQLDLAPLGMEEFVHTKNIDGMRNDATLTVFFNGTGSSIDKDTDPSLNYPEGELVSTLYVNCTGPCIQVDGVATGSEGGMYNIATGSGVTNRVKIVHDFIREHPEVTKVNIVGWSRGGVESIMLANALDGAREEYEDLGVNVNIMAFDPVPGTDGLEDAMDMKANLGKNVRTYKAFYARDEVSNSFSPIVPEIDSDIEGPQTVIDVKVVPGRHATLVGNYSIRGDKLKPDDMMMFGLKNKQKLQVLERMVEEGFDPNSVENVYETGKLVRDEAEKQLLEWGTPLENTLNLTSRQIEHLEQRQIENSRVYEDMRNHTYKTPSNVDERGLGSRNGDRLLHRVHAFYSMSKQGMSNFEAHLSEDNRGNQVDPFDEILQGREFDLNIELHDVDRNQPRKQHTPRSQDDLEEILGL